MRSPCADESLTSGLVAISTAASKGGNRNARSSRKSNAGESEGKAGAAYSTGNGLRLHKAYMSLLQSQQIEDCRRSKQCTIPEPCAAELS